MMSMENHSETVCVATRPNVELLSVTEPKSSGNYILGQEHRSIGRVWVEACVEEPISN